MTSGRAAVAVLALVCMAFIAVAVFDWQSAPANLAGVLRISSDEPPPESSDAAPRKGLTTKTIEAVKSVASQAGDIFTRVPCLPAKGIASSSGSLPRVAKRLAAGDPVTIVAFGSSTTVGYGTSSAAYTYPNRLADQLRRKFPTADISIVNRGMGGQDTPEIRARFINTIPLGRLTVPDDVVNAALFLASDSASFITGIEMPIDGGRTI